MTQRKRKRHIQTDICEVTGRERDTKRRTERNSHKYGRTAGGGWIKTSVEDGWNGTEEWEIYEEGRGGERKRKDGRGEYMGRDRSVYGEGTREERREERRGSTG